MTELGPGARLAADIASRRVDFDRERMNELASELAARERKRTSPLSASLTAALILVSFAAGFLISNMRQQGNALVSSGVTPITFVLVVDDARDVRLTGDFNNWSTQTRLQRGADGVWTVVLPLRPGRYNYAFIIDGDTWVRDPQAPPAAGEDFGRPSSVVLVEQRKS